MSISSLPRTSATLPSRVAPQQTSGIQSGKLPVSRIFERSAPDPKEGFQPSGKSDHSQKMGMIAMGLGTGALTIGGPGALCMGAIKAFATSHALLGTGLAVSGLGIGVMAVPIGLMGAAMSTDSGDSTGLAAFGIGAAVSLGAAALAIF